MHVRAARTNGLSVDEIGEVIMQTADLLRRPGRQPRVRDRPAGPRVGGVPVADVFVYDAVRTPFGRYGGALAGVRPDDLAALVVAGCSTRSPDLDPARVDEIVLGNANGAGEDNRNVGPDGRPARGAPGVGAGDDGQPALRLQPGRDHQRRTAGRARRGRVVLVGGVESMTRRPVGAAQAGARVPGRQHGAGVDHTGLAAGQPRDARGVDRLARRGDRAAARPARGQPRGPGRLRAAVAPVGRAAWDRGVLRRPGGRRARCRAGSRRVHPHRHHTGQARRPQADVPHRRHRDRRQRLAAQRRRVGRAARQRRGRALLGRAPLARVAGWGAAANEPQYLRLRAGRGRRPGAGARRHRLGRGRRGRAERGLRRAVARLRPGLGRRPRIVNRHGGAIAIGHPLGASGTRILGTLARPRAVRRTLGSRRDLHRRRARASPSSSRTRGPEAW